LHERTNLQCPPVFGGKLNAPESPGIEQFDPDMPSLSGLGIANPDHLKLPHVAGLFATNRDDLAQGIVPSGFEGCPEFTDAESYRVFSEIVALSVLSIDLDLTTEEEP
jgi:hypothetical protein